MAAVDASVTSVPGLSDAAAWITPDEARLVGVLLGAGQAHVFAGWTPGAHEDKKHAFFEQVRDRESARGDPPRLPGARRPPWRVDARRAPRTPPPRGRPPRRRRSRRSPPPPAHYTRAQVRALEHNYPGGVAAYCASARALLKASAAGENPFAGLKPEVPEGKSLEYGSPAFIEAEQRGLAAFKDAAFVLVAGGLGERLGYTDIKVSLPVQVTTGMTYLGLYAAQILAMQAACNARSGGAPSVVPLAIMTSDDTHARTVEMIAAHGRFGMAEGQITILKQEKVAALTDNDAHVAMVEGDPYAIDTKPHGHGDVHTLLASSGLAAKWAAEGRRYVVFFQDTNALCFTVTIAALGVSEELGFEVNSVTVPRKAKDAVGAITRLVRPDGSSITVNVEYNQLEPMLKASGFPEGDVNGPDGFSPFPGNINQLVFALGPYVEVLKRTGGLVPEFVNPKYADASKTKFKKPTRLECMMQEHPKVLGPGARVGFTNFPDWTYSPVKNAVEDALPKARAGVPGRSAVEGEVEFYAAEARKLAAAGVALPPPEPFSALGFDLLCGPKVVTHPNFAVSFANFKSKFPRPSDVRITARSTLVLSGPGVTIEALDLDGALVIAAVDGARVTVRRLRVANAGWPLVPLEPGAAVPDSLKIRGFTCVKKEARELRFDVPGEYVVDEA